MNGSAVVIAFDPFIHGFEVPSKEGLVAQAPYNDRRVQLVPLDHMLSSINIRMCPFWVVGRPSRGLLPGQKMTLTKWFSALFRAQGFVSDRLEPMALQVRLIYDPKPHLIGEIVQSWVINLMGCADCIDVVLLHGQKILLHEL
jgi:hypothetical protein